MRPSGTEPKLKCYLEAVAALDDGADASALSAAREVAARRVERVAADLPGVLGLPTPI